MVQSGTMEGAILFMTFYSILVSNVAYASDVDVLLGMLFYYYIFYILYMYSTPIFFFNSKYVHV